MPPKLTEEDGAPIRPMTANGLSEMLKRAANPVDTAPSLIAAPAPAEPPPAAAPPSSFGTPPPTPPPIPIPTFGPPSTTLTTEQILGHPLVAPPPGPPPPPMPDTGSGQMQKHIPDLTETARRKDKSSDETKRKSEAVIGRILTDYPTTRMVHVKLEWRDPITRSYRHKGRVKNVSVNDVRDPESWCEGPDGVMYGGDWVMGYMPADQGLPFDNAKHWYQFDFDRDGPEPPREWTIDQPIRSNLTVEVEGMGTIPLSELTKLIEGVAANAVKQAMQTPPTPMPTTPPVPQGYGPAYGQGYGPPGYGHPGYGGPGMGMGGMGGMTPPRDPKAEEREKKLEDALEAQRTQTAALMQRLNESDRKAAEDRARIEREAADARAKAEREAADARHAAELAALKSGFQSTVDQTARALEAVTAKLSAVEQRMNQPPPPPPPAPPPRDDFAALSTLKEILVGNRTAETEAAKMREAAAAEERRRDQDERQRRLEEERTTREREREEARDRREREHEDERARRDEERARREASDREAARTLEQYRVMGELSLASAKAVAEITGKQNDPAPTLSVMNAMAQQQIQHAQLLATLFKNFGQGGGGGGTNWPELIGQLAPDAFRAISDVGTAIAEASTNKAKIATQAAQAAAQAAAGPPPSAFAGMPQQPTMPQQPVPIPRVPQQRPPMPPQQRPPMPPQQQVMPQVAPQVAPPTPGQPPPQVNPLSALIAGVNVAIANKEAAEKVAGKLASIVHVAQEFGTAGTGKPVTGALKLLQDNPEKFLKRAYPSSDSAYLELIAKILLETYGPEEDDEEGEDNTEDAESTQEAQEAAQAAPQPPQEAGPPPEAQQAPAPPQQAPTEQEMLDAMAPPPPKPPTEEEMFAAMRRQELERSQPLLQPRPAKPTRVRIFVTGPDGTQRDVTPTSTPPEDNGNGRPKQRGRGGTRRPVRQVPLPEGQAVPPTSDGNGGEGSGGGGAVA